MAGILYVVATPIGNLEDVTLRALRILREVSLIAAEDTRRTARLLQHYSISTRTTSLHEHNEHARTSQLVERLQSGESVALVSDAGTPLVSDPGHHLVQAARDAGIRIEPVPGASAVMAALAASGWGGDGFTFLGFPPTRSKDRKQWFDRLSNIGHLTVIFEAPHRVAKTLAELGALFGGDHVIAIGRELTKSHEELVISPISVLVDRFQEPRGEFTLLIPALPLVPRAKERDPTPEELALELGHILESGAKNRREALRILAARHQLPVNALYRLLERSSDSGHKT
jgi:16S rRNA (cytidine1402-2'-O)-methyltransferase